MTEPRMRAAAYIDISNNNNKTKIKEEKWSRALHGLNKPVAVAMKQIPNTHTTHSTRHMIRTTIPLTAHRNKTTDAEAVQETAATLVSSLARARSLTTVLSPWP